MIQPVFDRILALWVSVRLLMLCVLAVPIGCVVAGEIPWVPEVGEIELLPDSAVEWTDESTGVTAGWQIRAPSGTVREAMSFSLLPVTAISSPTHGQGYELVAAAATLSPREVTFVEPLEIRIPYAKRKEQGELRTLLAPDAAHMGAGYWDFAEMETAEGQMRVQLPLSTTLWPVAVSGPPSASAATLPTVCIDPFTEFALDDAMERPEDEGECARSSDCRVSGCQNEICAPLARASVCIPAPRVCWSCSCLAGVCRWLQ